MGMSTGNAGSGGRRRRSRGGHAPMSEINMTPFIDVMLVLLIIFMVAAPLLTVGVPLDLPQTAAKPLDIETKPITLSVDEKGQVFIGETALKDNEIVPRLQAEAKQGFEERIFIRGHRGVNYGRVAQVMAIVTSAGFKKVALVTEQESRA